MALARARGGAIGAPDAGAFMPPSWQQKIGRTWLTNGAGADADADAVAVVVGVGVGVGVVGEDVYMCVVLGPLNLK